MKKISVTLLINVVFVLAGIIFLLYSQTADFTEWLSRVMGALFLLPALAYLLGGTWRRKAVNSNFYWLGVMPAVGGACFGVLMMVKAAMFRPLIVLLMGVLLLALGLFHVFYMLLSRRLLRLRLWHLVAPLLLIVAGALMLLVANAREHVVLISGIGMLLFAFTSVVEYFARIKDKPADQAGEVPAENSEATAQETSVATDEQTPA